MAGELVRPPTPDAPGWANAAMAVHSIRMIPTPMILRLVVADHGAITIDFRHSAYDWEVPLSQFPRDPSSVVLQTWPVADRDPAPFALPGQPLDALLWTIAAHCFGDEPATWLRPGEKYRLTRWPSFDGLPHTDEQLKMTSMLGTSQLTLPELADAAGVALLSAVALVNALTLLGVATADAPAAPVVDARRRDIRPAKGVIARIREGLKP